VPQGYFLGLTFPDPELRFDEAAGHWRFGAIDWDEFRNVLAGNGPCNRQRMTQRRAAHERGAWVREAAIAYGEKRRLREAAE
jgi:ring-1,2-phenylacetyl-CoA epoxidase subunit PaaA